LIIVSAGNSRRLNFTAKSQTNILFFLRFQRQYKRKSGCRHLLRLERIQQQCGVERRPSLDTLSKVAGSRWCITPRASAFPRQSAPLENIGKIGVQLDRKANFHWR
jgi:hypothetical protein